MYGGIVNELALLFTATRIALLQTHDNHLRVGGCLAQLFAAAILACSHTNFLNIDVCIELQALP